MAGRFVPGDALGVAGRARRINQGEDIIAVNFFRTLPEEIFCFA